MVPSQTRETISRHQMLVDGSRTLVGVSGGADSTCLLLVLRELGYDVAAAHLNHGLRGAESDADESFVKELAEKVGVPFYAHRVDDLSDQGNLEAAGRKARQAFFSELCRTHGFKRIALAHNRDDRAETFLLNLFRGAGSDGLGSMEPVAGLVIRPLIESSRADIEAFLQERHQAWRTDASNRDIRFTRNRLRLQTIPELRRDFNPSLVETLSRTIEIIDDENAFLQSLSSAWLQRHGTKGADNFVIDAEALVSNPLALQRRVLRSALREAGSTLENVTFEHIEAVRQLLRPGRSGKRIEIPGGFTISRSFGLLIVEERGGPAVEFEYQLQIPGEIHIPEIRCTFRAKIVSENGGKCSTEQVFVDGRDLGPYVRIRNWKPGDYYRPVGLPAGKLKKLFQRARIPRNQRHQVPVFVADSSIIWVASFPVSREFAPRGCSQKIVAFEAFEI